MVIQVFNGIYVRRMQDNAMIIMTTMPIKLTQTTLVIISLKFLVLQHLALIKCLMRTNLIKVLELFIKMVINAVDHKIINLLLIFNVTVLN
jgi:hypothetical protein